MPGSGPVAFASFTFDDGPGTSIVIVPSVIVGRRDGASWVTTIGDADAALPDARPIRPAGQVRYSDGSVTSAGYERAVEAAVGTIAAGALDKVVLARDLVASTQNAIDPRALLGPLSRVPTPAAGPSPSTA